MTHTTKSLTPTIDHSILQKRLVVAIDNANSEFEAFPELRCILQASSVVPDITVIPRNRVPLGNTPVAGAPDWTIEILSPLSRSKYNQVN